MSFDIQFQNDLHTRFFRKITNDFSHDFTKLYGSYQRIQFNHAEIMAMLSFFESGWVLSSSLLSFLGDSTRHLLLFGRLKRFGSIRAVLPLQHTEAVCSKFGLFQLVFQYIYMLTSDLSPGLHDSSIILTDHGHLRRFFSLLSSSN